MITKLVWIEIRTRNFISCIEFYEFVLGIIFEVRHLHDKKIAVFDEKEVGFRGCIIDSKETYQKTRLYCSLKLMKLATVLPELWKWVVK